jgi:transcriptional regulator with XRE-family HTH domain
MILKLPSEVLPEIAARARVLRKAQRLSQETLAARAGVSFGSVKRFERTGQISLESLLKLAVILDALGDFDALFAVKVEGLSLDDILRDSSPSKRKRS